MVPERRFPCLEGARTGNFVKVCAGRSKMVGGSDSHGSQAIALGS